jgi:transcriptional regulator with XRE-family HTH domain
MPKADKNGNYPAIEAIRVSIARKLILARRAAGLSQAEVARRAGIRAETLNRIEKAKVSADAATVESVEKVLASAKPKRAMARD